MTMNAKEDFVDVKLSVKGEELAAGSELHLCGGKYEFCFVAGESQSVPRAEWAQILSKENVDGEPLFEIATPAGLKPSATSEE